MSDCWDESMMHYSLILYHDFNFLQKCHIAGILFTLKLLWQTINPLKFGVLVNKTINPYLNVRKHLTGLGVNSGYVYGLLMNMCEFDRACSWLQHVFSTVTPLWLLIQEVTLPRKWPIRHKRSQNCTNSLAELINSNKEWPMNEAECLYPARRKMLLEF